MSEIARFSPCRASYARIARNFPSVLLLWLLLAVSGPSVFAQDEPTSANALSLLGSKSFKDKTAGIDELAASGHERALPIFKALLNGDLYTIKGDDSRLIIVGSPGETLYDAADGQPLGDLTRDDLKKIVINNQMRTQLRAEIASLSLSNPNASVRLGAVEEMMSDISPETVESLRELLARETDEDVRDAANLAIALVDLNATDRDTRLAAIKTVAQSDHPEVRVGLNQLVSTDTAGNPSEADATIRKAAAAALDDIEGRIKLYRFVETVFFGLSLGSVLLLAAIGLAITFGVMGVINMAHGELIMLGAYTTYVVQLLMPNAIEYSLLVAVPAAFLISGLVGIAIERGVIRFLYGRPLETLLATFGISLILQQAVRTIFSPLNRAVETPQWMSGAWEINSALSLTFNRLYIVIFSLMVFFALLILLKRSTFGLQLRAVSQNRSMAKAMGIRSAWVDSLTFGLGSGIAGVAGVALSQLTNVGPNLGQSYIIDSFMVVVFGGVGNLWGMLVGAFSLGVVNKFLEPWTGAVLAKILVLVFIILFIQKRPRGLFPQKGRAAEG